jgi:hypothetical protein
MSTNYTKLFSSLITSTIWSASHPTRVVWVTMLALADKNGEVHATIPGLARMANVTIPECEEAVRQFLAPDPYSRTPDDEGRRIEPIEGGWALINHGKYRLMASKEDEKKANLERQRRFRERNARTVTRNAKTVTCNAEGTSNNATVTQGRDIAEAEAEAESTVESSLYAVGVQGEIAGLPAVCAEVSAPASKVRRKKAKVVLTDEEWLADLGNAACYAHCDVPMQHAKAAKWCEVNRRNFTRKFFLNWLNRIEAPLKAGTTTKPRSWQPDPNDPEAF